MNVQFRSFFHWDSVRQKNAKKKDKKNKDQNLNLGKRKFSGEKGLSIKERRFDFHNPLIAH